MAIEYFCCYHDYREKLATLTDEEVGRVFRAALLYSATNKVAELSPLESLAFSFIRCDIDRTRREYERRCETNRANASRRNQSQATVNDGSQEKEEKNKNKIEEKEKAIKERIRASPPSTRTQHPTLEEVQAYCRERRSTVSAEAFFDFYEANGWKQGHSGKSIKDWKAAVRTWERRDRENGKTIVPAENKPDGIILPF